MGRGERNIESSKRSAGLAGRSRSPDVAAVSPIPPTVGDRVAKTNSDRPRREVVPLRERCWVSVDVASQVTGEGRTKTYALIALGKLLSKKVGRRRLVSVRSLLEYCNN
jgi:hypothetical protein